MGRVVIEIVHGYNCLSPNILTSARQLMTLIKLKPKDALHLACAESAGCDYFVTCDDVLIKRAARRGRQMALKVKVVNPVEFIRSEGNRYGKS